MRILYTIFLFLFSTFCWVANAQEHKSEADWYGVYSDVRYSPESGDLIGREIFILPGQGSIFVLYQEMAGEPTSPVLVEAQVKNDVLVAKIPFGSKSILLNAKIIKETLIFNFETNPSEEIRLKRGMSYLQKMKRRK